MFGRREGKGQEKAALSALQMILPNLGLINPIKCYISSIDCKSFFSAMMKPGFKIYGFILEMDYKKSLT